MQKGEAMDHAKKALELLNRDGVVCAPSVFGAFADECGLSEEQALRTAACFGGGMGRGEVCGACTGALMVLGMKYGFPNPEAPDDLDSAAEKAWQFLDEFKKRRGSYLCRDLLGCDLGTDEGAAYAMEHELFQTVCPKMVAAAAEILDGMLSE